MEPQQQSAASVLRKLREAQGRSLRTAADELGFAASQLSRMERGQRSYTAEVSQKLASYYGVDSELLDLAQGRIPEDLIEILQDHPDEIERLRKKYGSASS